MLEEIQQKKLKKFFSVFDTDKNGTIEQMDYRKICDNFANLTKIEKSSMEYSNLYGLYTDLWSNVLKKADLNNDDKITFNEFATYWTKILNTPKEAENLVMRFGSAILSMLSDKENNPINLDKYSILIKSFGLDNFNIRENYTKLANKNGTITFDEAQQLGLEFFMSKDKSAKGNVFFGPIV